MNVIYVITFAAVLQPWRPSLQTLFEDYWRLMPQYQQLPGGLQQLEFQRLLFGFFPTYKDSPLAPGFDRCVGWRPDSGGFMLAG
jgi:lycopene cyclase CruP